MKGELNVQKPFLRRQEEFLPHCTHSEIDLRTPFSVFGKAVALLVHLYTVIETDFQFFPPAIHTLRSLQISLK